jgi:hypothetical protein
MRWEGILCRADRNAVRGKKAGEVFGGLFCERENERKIKFKKKDTAIHGAILVDDVAVLNIYDT